jgi:hypothetical protein
MRSRLVSGARVRDEAGRADGAIRGALVPAGDPPPPEIVELTGTAARLGPGRSVTWLVCGTVVLGMVVGLGLVGRMETRVGSGGNGPGKAAVARGDVAHESLIPGSNDVRPAPPGLGTTPGSTPPRHQRIVILLPAPGEVILGAIVPVAGRIAGPGPPRGVVLTVVHVAIVAENTTLGEADLPIVGGRFAGWVEVMAPVRGRVVVIRAWDALRPSRGPSIQEFVLRARTDAGSGIRSFAPESLLTLDWLQGLGSLQLRSR